MRDTMKNDNHKLFCWNCIDAIVIMKKTEKRRYKINYIELTLQSRISYELYAIFVQNIILHIVGNIFTKA